MNSISQCVADRLSCDHTDLRKGLVDCRSSTCLLCERGGLTTPAIIQFHFQDPIHLANEEKLVILLEKAKESLIRTLSRRHMSTIDEASAIPSQFWKNSIQAGMYRYVIAPFYDDDYDDDDDDDDDEINGDDSDDEDDDDDDDDLLEAALDTLQRFRYHEGFVVLALAVWKSECLRRMPIVNVDFYAVQQWMSGGWKSCKTEENSNAGSTIVSLVRPFVSPGEQ